MGSFQDVAASVVWTPTCCIFLVTYQEFGIKNKWKLPGQVLVGTTKAVSSENIPDMSISF